MTVATAANVAICEALGLDPAKIRHLTITLDKVIGPVVRVELVTSIDAAVDAAAVIERYKLVPLTDGPPADPPGRLDEFAGIDLPEEARPA